MPSEIISRINPEQLYARLVAEFTRCNWSDAKHLVEMLLPLAPQHAGVFGMAGVISLELKAYVQAEEYLRKARELDPLRADFATLHAKALLHNQRHGEAVTAARSALALGSDDPAVLDAMGVIFTQEHDHEHAAKAFEKAAALAPSQSAFRFNFATSLVAIGHIDAAERELEAIIVQDPTCWKVYLSLAQLRKQTRDNNHIERLKDLLTHYSARHARIYLNMALASELADLGEHQVSFQHLCLGKVAAKNSRRYPLERDQKLFHALQAAFREYRPTSGGDPTPEPIFVVGMPRSGTTLLDRILSSHPDVQSAGELQNFNIALQQVAGDDFPFSESLVARASAIDWHQLGSAYLSSTRSITGNSARFVDKLPHNFLYLGFIINALPNARIICARRNPLDTCLSNFRQLFAETSPYLDYSLDLMDTGRYYLLFEQLMTHWKRLFPGRILEVEYEELVQSQESVSRHMLAFCDLPWHDACLRFEQNAAPVDTLSASQVREPLYRSAVQRWRCYERELAPLRALLCDAGIIMDD